MNRPLVLIAALGVTSVVAGAVVALLVPADDDSPRRTPAAVVAPTIRTSASAASPPVASAPATSVPATKAPASVPASVPASSASSPGSADQSEPMNQADALRAKVPGDHVAYVSDTDTAATWDDQGAVTFWLFTQSGWQRQGRSTFPRVLDGTLEVTGYSLGYDPVGPDRATVVVYVVAGQFTTDAGSGVLVYGPGRAGWGALEDDGSALVSHGRGASVEGGTGLFEQVSIGADAAVRTLTTGVCPQDLPRYRCGDSTAEQSQWRWDDTTQGLKPISR